MANCNTVKNRLFFISLLVVVNLACWGQEGLLIKNIRTGKAWMYEKNSRITYIRFHEQDYQTGILIDLLDSSVVLNKDTIALKSIAGVRKKNSFHTVSRIIGMPLMLIGSLLMGQGAASIYSDPDSEGGIKNFLLGATVFIVGYIPYELNLEELTVGFEGEWTLEIYRGQLVSQ